MGDRGTVHHQQERVSIVPGHPCQQVFTAEIPKPCIFKKIHIRVERVATFSNRRANQLTDRFPCLLILKVRADHQRMGSFWELLHVPRLRCGSTASYQQTNYEHAQGDHRSSHGGPRFDSSARGPTPKPGRTSKRPAFLAIRQPLECLSSMQILVVVGFGRYNIDSAQPEVGWASLGPDFTREILPWICAARSAP